VNYKLYRSLIVKDTLYLFANIGFQEFMFPTTINKREIVNKKRNRRKREENGR